MQALRAVQEAKCSVLRRVQELPINELKLFFPIGSEGKVLGMSCGDHLNYY
jgi:hypothetical protein